MSAAPTRATGREQAKRFGYPCFTLMSSTPNGAAAGTNGYFFFEYWSGAVDSDLLFELDTEHTKPDEKNQNFVYEKFVPNADEIAADPRSNSFVRVKFKWDEDPRKTQEWYQKQCQELNFNMRKIGQEIDLEFVGSSDCPFSDDVLKKLTDAVIKPIGSIPLSHSANMKLYDEVNQSDYYLIGVDTASAINGCFSAIEVYSFLDFKQVGELAIRVGSLHQYGEMVYDVIKYFVNESGGRVIVVIENNSIGKSIVEQIQMSDLSYYLYHERDKIDSHGIVTEYGISTNARTKPLMVAEAYARINDYPENFKSEELVNQLHALERSNSGQLTSSAYTDIFMATCFCAYARKQKELDILPLIKTNELVEKQQMEVMTDIIKMSSPKNYAIKKEEHENLNYVVSEKSIFDENPDNVNVDDNGLPFFFSI